MSDYEQDLELGEEDLELDEKGLELEKQDLELLERVFRPLDNKLKEAGPDALSDVQAAIVYALNAKVLVDNGGLIYYYQYNSEVESVAKAFDTLGHPEVADAFRQSAKVFPNGVIPSSGDRDEWIEEHYEELEQAFEPLHDPIFALGLRYESEVAAFVRRHPDEFGLEESVQ